MEYGNYNAVLKIHLEITIKVNLILAGSYIMALNMPACLPACLPAGWYQSDNKHPVFQKRLSRALRLSQALRLYHNVHTDKQG